MVRVASFTFRFASLEQLRDCHAYYDAKLHPSSRISHSELLKGGGDRFETQRWFERLPMHLLEEPKRQKVVKALAEALLLVESGKL